MTKQAFIKELNDRLSQTDDSLRAEICHDIDLHFREGLASGLTEEEVCRNLGQPGNIAEQILEEYQKKPNSEAAPAPPLHNGDRGEPKRMGPAGGHFYDIDIDRHFTGVNDIDIKLKTNNLIIKENPQGQNYRVTVKGRSRYNMFTVENIGGELCVIEDAPFIRFELFGVKTKLETVVWVPPYFAGEIKAHVTNGEIQTTGARGRKLALKSAISGIRVENSEFGEYDIKASAGKVEVRRSKGEKLQVTASAGSVTMEDCPGNIFVNASAGSVSLTDCRGDVHIHASAGSVQVNGHSQVLGSVKIESSAGSVKVRALEAGDMNLSSSAGSINVQAEHIKGDTRLHSGAGSVKLETRRLEGNIDAHSSMGSVKISIPDGSVNRVESETRMGSVKNNIKCNQQSPYFVKALSQMGSVRVEPV
jgi:DUF4097 and DUF4098 domain-containing protein YvlB